MAGQEFWKRINATTLEVDLDIEHMVGRRPSGGLNQSGMSGTVRLERKKDRILVDGRELRVVTTKGSNDRPRGNFVLVSQAHPDLKFNHAHSNLFLALQDNPDLLDGLGIAGDVLCLGFQWMFEQKLKGDLAKLEDTCVWQFSLEPGETPRRRFWRLYQQEADRDTGFAIVLKDLALDRTRNRLPEPGRKIVDALVNAVAADCGAELCDYGLVEEERSPHLTLLFTTKDGIDDWELAHKEAVIPDILTAIYRFHLKDYPFAEEPQITCRFLTDD